MNAFCDSWFIFRWKTVEFESAIEGKMAKIAQLQRSLAVKDEVGRLQQQVRQVKMTTR